MHILSSPTTISSSSSSSSWSSFYFTLVIFSRWIVLAKLQLKKWFSLPRFIRYMKPIYNMFCVLFFALFFFVFVIVVPVFVIYQKKDWNYLLSDWQNYQFIECHWGNNNSDIKWNEVNEVFSHEKEKPPAIAIVILCSIVVF